MRGIFVDAGHELAEVFRRVVGPGDPIIIVNEQPQVAPTELPTLLAGFDFVVNDHTSMPAETMAFCTGLKHIIFLGTGARSYMDPEALAKLGIVVHTIKGYGDTAVAEHTIALMWAATRGLARMDRGIREGNWPRTQGFQLTGKTLGLVGFGGIAAEVARIARGSGMHILAWNRTPRTATGVTFVPLKQLLEESDVVSIHVLLTDETRGFLSADHLRLMREGAILINTARGALVNEAAMIKALQTRHLSHAALDVFLQEPLPPGHDLSSLENVTLSAHSAFRTPEASENLIRNALNIARKVAAAAYD